MNQPSRTIAIVGCGPRGLSALESLFVSLSKENINIPPSIIVFEEAKALGCGAIYNANQPDSNWLNISERALTLSERPEINIGTCRIKAFPSYHQWTGKTKEAIVNNVHEVFPKRSELGAYLHTRYQSLAPKLIEHGWLTVIKNTVIGVETINNRFNLSTNNDQTFTTDEVLLTIGHQDTVLSKQIKAWQAFTKDNSNAILHKDTYPIANVLKTDFKNTKHSVGIRGFGLAMIDLVRALCEVNGGVFEITDKTTHRMRYIKGKTPLQLVPFSLDGLPMASKPLNSKVDALFTPSDARLLAFESHLKHISKQTNHDQGIQFLIEAMASIAAHQYLALKSKAYAHTLDVNDLQAVITAYLKDDRFTHDLLLSQEHAPEFLIQSFIAMATASKPISLDYCLGQVWRHCEPILYKTMSHSQLPDATVKAVIALDARMKRYAFGPPIESLQQLYALIEAGTLDLNYVNNPDITLVDKGWKLSNDGQNITVDVMINSVLDRPKLLKVSSPLIVNLLKDRAIQAVHSELGVETKSDGSVVSEGKAIDLTLLGRLAKGSIVGVDAILECFGPRIEAWADGAVKRYLEPNN